MRVLTHAPAPVLRAPKAVPAEVKALLVTMRANVVKITDPAEKERWTANCDLWQAMIAKM